MNCPGCGALILSDEGPPAHEGTLTPHPITGQLYHAACLATETDVVIGDAVEAEALPELPPVPKVPVPRVPGPTEVPLLPPN